MSPATPDDDPTHALDDFVRRMRPAAQPAATADADLADLQAGLLARLHPERASRAAAMPRPKGGTLRSGQTWDADDVVDVPDRPNLQPEVQRPRVPAARPDIPAVTLPIVDLLAEQAQALIAPTIDLPPVTTPPPPEAGVLDDSTQRASHAVAAQQVSQDHDNAEPGWQPGLQSLQLRRAGHLAARRLDRRAARGTGVHHGICHHAGRNRGRNLPTAAPPAAVAAAAA
jgi:hypothetical protein